MANQTRCHTFSKSTPNLPRTRGQGRPVCCRRGPGWRSCPFPKIGAASQCASVLCAACMQMNWVDVQQKRVYANASIYINIKHTTHTHMHINIYIHTNIRAHPHASFTVPEPACTTYSILCENSQASLLSMSLCGSSSTSAVRNDSGAWARNTSSLAGTMLSNADLTPRARGFC